jgi:TPR repeat protein
MYLKGSGVPVNRQKGLRWLRRGLASQNAETVELCRELQAETGL